MSGRAPGTGRLERAGRPGRSGRLRRLLPGRSAGAKIAAGLLILMAWQVGVAAFAPRYVAKPLNVIAVFPKVITDQAFLDATFSTLFAVLQGLLIAIAAGTFVGVAMGRVKLVDRMLNVYVNAFFTMPMVAILPLLTIWFGYDEQARMATIIFAAFFSITINARDGARAIPHEYLEVARAYRARPRHVWLGIAIFASLPYLIAGIRLSAGRALVGAVIAEFFVSIEGLGLYILTHTRSFQHNEAVVGVLMLAAFGLAFEGLMNASMRWFLPWYRR